MKALTLPIPASDTPWQTLSFDLQEELAVRFIADENITDGLAMSSVAR
jgi:hypothetical protein